MTGIPGTPYLILDNVVADYVNKFMDYDYDQFGNKDKLTVKEGSAAGATLFAYDYSYNKLEQLTGLSGPGGTTGFDYLPTGRMKTKTFPNGVIGNYTYFDNGDIQNINYNNSHGFTLLALSYSYDNASNIDSKTKDGVLYNYSYDNLYQLTGVTIPSATSQNESFTYDGVGNRLTSIDKPAWNYNNNNQLLGYDGVSFGYDANGNTISKTEGGTTENYGYDLENRLISYSSATVSASYQYEPMGRRIEKDVDGSITKFLWDGNVMIAELDTSNNISKLYTYNPQTSEPISFTEAGNSYWYLNDHLMTPQKMVDSSGTVVWAAEYKAFGEVTINPSSTITNNLRFPGQYCNEESGLHYNYRRFYMPIEGRYSSEELINFADISSQISKIKFTIKPIKYSKQDIEVHSDILGIIAESEYQKQLLLLLPRLQQPYNYGLNNPLKYFDPDGDQILAAIGIGLAVSGVILTGAYLYKRCIEVCIQCPEMPECDPLPPDDPNLFRRKGQCIDECRGFAMLTSYIAHIPRVPKPCK